MFNIGEYIKLKNSSITGTILDKNDKYYKIQIENNSTIMYTDENKIEKCDKAICNNKNKININYNLYNKEISYDIMLRHQTKLEALENLDKFIFSAIANHQKRVRIIHGRNGGILREAVHEYLKNNEYVENFHIADNKEGSIGVTIAYLK